MDPTILADISSFRTNIASCPVSLFVRGFGMYVSMMESILDVDDLNVKQDMFIAVVMARSLRLSREDSEWR
mgnify:CR=1 FL=1